MFKKSEIQALVNNLLSNDIEAQRKTAALLMNLSSENYVQRYLIELDCMPALTTYMFDLTDMRIKEKMVGAISNLCANPVLQRRAIDVGVIRLLVNLLTEEYSIKTRRRSAGALSNLALNHQDKYSVGEMGAVAALTCLLLHEDVKAQVNAATALWCLLSAHYHNQARFVEERLQSLLWRYSDSIADSHAAKRYVRAVNDACDIYISEDQVSALQIIAGNSKTKVERGVWKEKIVAVKSYIGARLTEEISKLVLQEAHLLRSLRHNNIVEFYKLIPYVDQPPKIVMEFGNQGSLYEYIQRSRGHITWQVKFRFALELSEGLAYLHDKNIVHRDIKSLNVVLDDTYQAKWCDFGEAEIRQHAINTSQLTPGRPEVGTLPWMAPELFKRETAKASRKSDIWSLGMVFFELVSERTPFSEAVSEEVLIEWVKNGDGEHLTAECEIDYPRFSNLIQSCWKKPPRERPDANTVVDQCRALL